jgi:hypothetical protein
VKITVPVKYAGVFQGLANSPLVRIREEGGRLTIETPVGFTLMLKASGLTPKEFSDLFTLAHLEGGYKRRDRGSLSFLPRRTKRLTLRLSPEELDLLRRVAEIKGMKSTEYIISSVLEKLLQDHSYLEGAEHG